MPDNHHVLVADDDDSIRHILVQQLTEAGFSVDDVADGDAAIARLKTKHYDVALLDVRMPTISGIDVLRFIHAETPGTKAIILTGFSDLALAVQAMELGAIDFFNKPFSITDVLESVKHAVAW